MRIGGDRGDRAQVRGRDGEEDESSSSTRVLGQLAMTSTTYRIPQQDREPDDQVLLRDSDALLRRCDLCSTHRGER
jgi:hypothetical protein